jgi:hypothetical protein
MIGVKRLNMLFEWNVFREYFSIAFCRCDCHRGIVAVLQFTPPCGWCDYITQPQFPLWLVDLGLVREDIQTKYSEG